MTVPKSELNNMISGFGKESVTCGSNFYKVVVTFDRPAVLSIENQLSEGGLELKPSIFNIIYKKLGGIQ